MIAYVSERPLYSPACPVCGATDEWHYDSYNDTYLCQQRWVGEEVEAP